MVSNRNFSVIFLLTIAFLVIGCTAPTETDQLSYGGSHEDTRNDSPEPESTQFLKNATFDAFLGNLDDPDVLAKATRGNLLITDCSRFWGKPGLNDDLARLRAENPDLKIIGYFRNKTVRLSWGEDGPHSNTFNRELYEASLPYWSYTTTGDTLQDWPEIANFSPLTQAARQAMIDVLVRYQNEAQNKLDGVFWDYFNFQLWISPDVHTMEGEPDLDGNGIDHWHDNAEIEAYQASEVSFIQEMRAAMGEDFIQIVNGSRALQDSSFAQLVDGMFYETFPNVGFKISEGFIQALDPNWPNNLWAAHQWPRTQNGGPWLILSNKSANNIIAGSNGNHTIINLGDYNRAVALLVGGTSVYYDLSGRHEPGYPPVELDLGQAVTGVTIDGNRYEREFENGRIELVMGTGALPIPFSYEIHQDGELIQSFDFPTFFP
jgi:Hypothetical glycosyl hydrolase family 15